MKVGDYVRTINGEIYKLIDDFALIYFQKEQEHGIPEHQITKSSSNIIDLIEVGDYVNGIKVDYTNINDKLSYEDKCIGFYDGDGDITLFENDIKSIVTKEQFESMEYKVGEQ